MYRFRSDEPTLVDELFRLREPDPSRRNLVRSLGDAVAGCDPPQVFGLHGDWGSGKTSCLYQLHWYLAGSCPQAPPPPDAKLAGLGKVKSPGRVTVVWFEAWRYQHEKAPIVALLQEIRAQLPWQSKAFTETRKLGEVAVRGALLSLEDLTKRIGIQASKIQEAGEQWESENLASRLPSHMIRQHLESALRTLLGRKSAAKGDRHRLVVLVDDLDRCEPETAYQLLEGIKIYLNLPSCVFVLAMNQRVIEGAVARHLAPHELDQGTDAEQQARILRRRAREYLEKLCGHIWHLPFPKDVAGLLERFLTQEDGSPALEGQAAICALVRRYRTLPPIPRKVKAYANLLLRVRDHLHERQAEAARGHAAAAGPPDTSRWAKLAIVFTYLYQFHPELYRLLADRPWPFYQQLREWCEGREGFRAQRHFVGLRHLSTSLVSDAQETQAVPKPTYESEYHDPAADDILHVEELVKAIGSITQEEAEGYLLP